jgi:hypothetical protein
LRCTDGFRRDPIARYANAIQPDGIIDFAHQIGGEHDRAVDQCDDGEFLLAVHLFDFAGETAHTTFDLFLGEKNRCEVWVDDGSFARPGPGSGRCQHGITRRETMGGLRCNPFLTETGLFF